MYDLITPNTFIDTEHCIASSLSTDGRTPQQRGHSNSSRGPRNECGRPSHGGGHQPSTLCTYLLVNNHRRRAYLLHHLQPAAAAPSFILWDEFLLCDHHQCASAVIHHPSTVLWRPSVVLRYQYRHPTRRH